MPPTAFFRRSVAIVVGIDDYGDPKLRLDTPAADATSLAEILRVEHGYEVRLLLNGEATCERLDHLLTQELPAEIDARDRVLFYFAGHGVALKSNEGPNGYLLLHGAQINVPSTYLHMPRLHDTLLALECRHMLVILDSCFSGAFRWSSTRGVPQLPEVIYRERFDRFIHDPAWQVITSASHNQTANDDLGIRGDSDGHSPFALALFDALRGAADLTPPGGDSVITATELYLYLESQVQPETIDVGARYRQTPRLWPLEKHDNGEYIFLRPGSDPVLPPAPPLTYENNPYRGLEAYDITDAELFFGRDRVIKELMALVLEQPLTVVLGASGTGKSSLAKAGLVRQLQLDDRDRKWQVVPVVRPGADPIEALRSVTRFLAPDAAAPADNLSTIVDAWLDAHPDKALVLIVDQLEELATQVGSPELRVKFLKLLADLCQRRDGRVRVVTTLRSDFEPQFVDSPLRDLWLMARFIVPPMTQDELRAAIEQPASKRVLYFDDRALVDDLINEVVQMPGGLPLLSFALSEMYLVYVKNQEQRNDRALRREDYKTLGGVIGALRHRANEVYDAFDAAHQATMRRVMLRMVATDGGTLLRRRVPLTELEYSGGVTSDENRRVGRILDALVDARLVVRGAEPNGAAYAEPAHDALVSAWDRLIAWIHQADVEGPDFSTRRKLALSASDWQAALAGEKGGLLWSDRVRAPLLGQLLRKRASWLNRSEREFAERSVKGRQWRTRVIGLATIALLVIGAVAWYQGRQAQASARRADSRALATVASREPELDIATLLAVEALQRDDNYDSRNAALTSMLQPGLQLRREIPCDFIAFSPDNRTIAASCDGGITLFDETTGWSHQIGLQAAPSRRSNAGDWGSFTYDGTVFASVAPAGVVHLWSVATRQPLPDLVPSDYGYDAIGAVMNPAKKILAVTGTKVGGGRVITLWDIDAKHIIDEFPGGGDVTLAAAFSADGQLLAFKENGAERSIGLWDVEARKPIGSMAVPADIRALTFGPDKRSVTVSDADGTLQVLGVPAGNVIKQADVSKPIEELAYTADRRLIAVIGGREIRAGQPFSLNPLEPDDGRSSFVAEPRTGESFAGVQVSRDGRMLAANARLFRLRPLSPLSGRLAGHSMLWESHPSERSAGAVSLAYSHDGRWLASGGSDRTVWLWDRSGVSTTPCAKGCPLPSTHKAAIVSVAFSPDGQLLASAGRDSLRLWSVNQRKELQPPLWIDEHFDQNARPGSNRVAFGPDGRSLRAVVAGELRVWELQNPPVARQITGPGHLTVAEFSPDGRFLVYGGPDEPIQTWEVDANANGRQLSDRLSSVQSEQMAFAFTPDGRSVLAAGGGVSPDAFAWLFDFESGNRVDIKGAEGGQMPAFSHDAATLSVWGTRLFDLSSGRQLGPAIDVGPGSFEPLSTAFSPSADVLALGLEDGTIRFLDLSRDGLKAIACQSVRANLPADVWKHWIPERPYECTCPNLPAGEDAKCQ